MQKITKEYVDYVLLSIKDINPYHTSSSAMSWSTGFYAAQLAQIFENDPILFRKYKLAVNEQRKKQGLRPL